MTQAKAGDTVQFHYSGTLTDGSVFDSSQGREPLSFTLGSGQIVAGLDAAISGMTPGEQKTVTIPAARAQIPDTIPTEPGTRLPMQSPQGQVIPVTVVEADSETVVLDANHRLAGKDLIFALEIVSVG